MSARPRDLSLYARRKAELIALCGLIDAGHGYVQAWASDARARPSAMRSVLLGGGVACDALSLADDHARGTDWVPWMAWQAIIHSQRCGAPVHDFHGANSLVRSSDVHSYGALAAPYLRVGYMTRQRDRGVATADA